MGPNGQGSEWPGYPNHIQLPRPDHLLSTPRRPTNDRSSLGRWRDGGIFDSKRSWKHKNGDGDSLKRWIAKFFITYIYIYTCFLGGNVFFLINFGFLLRCGYIDGKKNWILVGMNALLNGGKWSLLTWLIFRKKKSFGFVFSWCWCRFKNYIEFAAGSIPTSTLADCRAQPARAWPLWPNQIRPKPFSALETVYLTAYFCLEKQPSLTSRSKIFSCESSRKSEPPFSLGWMTCFWLSHGLWMTLGHNTGG